MVWVFIVCIIQTENRAYLHIWLENQQNRTDLTQSWNQKSRAIELLVPETD